MFKQVCFIGTSLLTLAFSQPGGAEAATAYLYANDGYTKDATIFQNNPGNSNGAGPGMFVGSNSGTSPRRGLIEFDLATYDSDNSNVLTHAHSIDAVRLKLVVGQKAGSGGGGMNGGGACPGGDSTNRTIDLYKVIDVIGSPASSGDWNEASTGSSSMIGGTGQGVAANTGDTTWDSRIYSANPAWASGGGGDYSGTASDSQNVGNNCPAQITWSSANMLTDVTGWLGTPSTNRGWILINQSEAVSQSFRAFWTKEGEALSYTIGSPAITHYGPVLEIDYTP